MPILVTHLHIVRLAYGLSTTELHIFCSVKVDFCENLLAKILTVFFFFQLNYKIMICRKTLDLRNVCTVLKHK